MKNFNSQIENIVMSRYFLRNYDRLLYRQKILKNKNFFSPLTKMGGGAGVIKCLLFCIWSAFPLTVWPKTVLKRGDPGLSEKLWVNFIIIFMRKFYISTVLKENTAVVL